MSWSPQIDWETSPGRTLRKLFACVELFRPGYDEELGGDIKTNTRLLWEELWGKEIDVHREMIAPAREIFLKAYEQDRPKKDHRSALDDLGAS